MLKGRHGLRNVARLPPYGSAILCKPVTTRFRHYSSSTEPKDVAILGSGITGLATAYYLSQSLPATKITVYEAGSRVGGWLESVKVPIDDGEILFEKGPRTLRPAGNGILAARMISELGLQDETIFTLKTAPAATNRYIYYPDHLVRVPQPDPSKSLWENVNVIGDSFVHEDAFRGLMSKILFEHFVRTRDSDVVDESVGHFFKRRLGKNMVDRVLSAVMHGIYAGDVYKLSMKALFSNLFRLEGESGSLTLGFLQSFGDGPKIPMREANFLELMQKPFPFDKQFKKNLMKSSVFTFRNGLQQLVDALKEDLRGRHNVTFLTNTPIKSIDNEGDAVKLWVDGTGEPATHTHVISSLSPKHLRQVLDKPGVGNYGLHSIGYAPTVMTVNLYFRTPNLHPPGFGYLIPLATSIEQNPERALGVVFDDGYSAATEDDGHIVGPMQDTVSNRGTKVTVMLGGHYWDAWNAYPSEEEGVEMALSVVQRHLGITEPPAATGVSLAKDCIPQYTVGYEDKLKNVHAELLDRFSGRLRVAGNWFRGVGVNDCLRSAWEVVRELRDERKTGLEVAVEDKNWVTVQPVQMKKRA
ncbi:hypothetical protein AAFC00_001068 [Neodothiora populina]|uniref:Protoporphyrinogen oxidase n=1 Tax=Neodothiora populina TaxID=2781224 RepID=A0ABR3PMN9_9PEZI